MKLIGLFFVALLTIPLGNPPPAEDCGAACRLSAPQARAAGVTPPSDTPPFAVPPSATRPAGRYGAFSLARPPSFRYGLSVGQVDRRAAQEAAEAACRAAPRGCTRIVEFTAACIAVAEGIKRVGLFITSDPRTYEVRGIDHGTASNPADAQHAALRECRARERGALNCRVVQTACAPR